MTFYVVQKEKLETLVKNSLVGKSQIDSLKIFDKDLDNKRLICEYKANITINNKDFDIPYILKFAFDEDTNILNNTSSDKYEIGKEINILLSDSISDLEFINMPIIKQVIYINELY